MDTQALEVIAAVEGTHWWYRARRRILGAVVDRLLTDGVPHGPTLDFGCGTGANLPVVERCGAPTGCDVSPVSLAFARARGGYERLVSADGAALPFRSGSFTWVFATDVLEHLDDASAAAELRRVLRAEGRAVITVPAFPALWGPNDDASHHLRRYTRASLRSLLGGAGLEVRYLSYMNSALFLPIWAARRAMRLLRLRESENTLHPGWANPILERVFGAEALLLPRFALPFGVSLLCVASPRRGS